MIEYIYMKRLTENLYILILIAVISVSYILIFIDPALVLSRNNDLQNVFWPVFYFIRQQIQIQHTLPLWNNLFLSGTPLLPDPQFSLFYPPNLLFMIFPTNLAFIAYFFIHSIIGSLGMYWLSRKAFNFSKPISLFTTLMYLFSPKMAGFLEAGHFGLFASFAWLPFILLSSIKLTQKTNILWAILLSVSLAAIFYTHTVMFVLVSAVTFIMVTILLFSQNLNKSARNLTVGISSLLSFLMSFIMVVGLIAVTLLPQIEWLPETTRFLLLQVKETYPIWTSIKEFIQIVFLPFSIGIQGIWTTDSEKWIALGFIPSVLTGYGIWNLKRRFKILVVVLIGFSFIISLNNASHIYSSLLKMDWFVLMRVSTRIWFIPIMLVTILNGFALEKMREKRYRKSLILLIATLAILEEITLSAIYLRKPVAQDTNGAPAEIYSLLKQDPELFRVYCVNRCLSQQKAAENNLQLIDGYNTLIQKNFYQQSWQLTGAYWNYYTLSIPPVGTYTFEKPQPDPISLGEFNTKYIISPYPLTNNNINLKKQFNNYYLYENKLLRPRAYFLTNKNSAGFVEAPITKYTPNQIIIDTTSHAASSVILSEVYSKGWKAYLNGKTPAPIQETPNALRAVDIQSDTKYVAFKYEPASFKVGELISVITILTIVNLIIFRKIQRKK